jgi:hypothetical protein
VGLRCVSIRARPTGFPRLRPKYPRSFTAIIKPLLSGLELRARLVWLETRVV